MDNSFKLKLSRVQVCRHRRGKPVLSFNEMEVNQGEKIWLSGNNGSGKTTLLLLLARLLNEKLTKAESWSDSFQSRRMMLQSVSSQLFQWTVAEELAMALNRQGRTVTYQQLCKISTRYNLENLLNDQVATLSGGEKQRLLLAVTLLARVDLLLLDEPFASLDPVQKQHAGKLINEEETLLITQHRHSLTWTTRQIHLEAGRLSEPPESDTDPLKTDSTWSPSPAAAPGETLIEFERLLQHPGDGTRKLKLDYRNFPKQIRRGEWICLAGQNGSGKTTFARIISGRLKPDQGRVHQTGELHRIGWVPHDCRGITLKDTLRNEYAWRQISNSKNDNFEQDAELLGLQAFATRDPLALSQGETQRAAILLAAAASPDLLILDEPLAYQDLPGARSVLEFLRNLTRRGSAVLSLSNDDHEAAGWTDQIWKIPERNTQDDYRE